MHDEKFMRFKPLVDMLWLLVTMFKCIEKRCFVYLTVSTDN